MIIVSEQQTFAKLRIAPEDFVKLLDENPDKAMEYINTLQGEREKTTEKKTRAPKDPNAPPVKRGRKIQTLDLSKLS